MFILINALNEISHSKKFLEIFYILSCILDYWLLIFEITSFDWKLILKVGVLGVSKI